MRLEDILINAKDGRKWEIGEPKNRKQTTRCNT